MSRLEIRPYDPEQCEPVLHLQQQLWASDHDGRAAYLRWKYSDNPYLDHRYVALAWEGRELVGMVGAFGARWEVPDRDPLLIPCLADAVLQPSLRGTELFRKMVDSLCGWLRRDGLAWLLDFGNGRAAAALVLHGWKSIGPWSVAQSIRTTPVTTDTWWSDTQLHPGSRTGVPILAGRVVDAEAVALMAARVPRAPGVLRHARHVEYLDWWFSNPLSRLFFLRAGGDEVKGTLVAHHGLDAYDAATPTTVLDCEADSDALWLDLVELATRRLPGRSVVLWTRDLSPSRQAAVSETGLTRRSPSGQLSRDFDLPNMLVCATGAPPRLDLDIEAAHTWDLRGVCGRSWR